MVEIQVLNFTHKNMKITMIAILLALAKKRTPVVLIHIHKRKEVWGYKS
jgi:hypothetical protein